MRRIKENMLGMTAILLLAGLGLAQWGGIPQLEKVTKGMSNPAGQGTFMMADGPAPMPSNPPVRRVRFTVS